MSKSFYIQALTKTALFQRIVCESVRIAFLVHKRPFLHNYTKEMMILKVITIDVLASRISLPHSGIVLLTSWSSKE